MPVLVVGSIALDTIHFNNGAEHKDVAGGSCSYFAAAARFLAPQGRVQGLNIVGGHMGKAGWKGPEITMERLLA